MPIYDYRCLVCGATKEVIHSMAELSAPSAATLQAITCCKVTVGSPLPDPGTLLDPAPRQVPAVMTRYLASAPAYGKVASMTPSQRREAMTKRSREHFQREGKEQKHEMNRKLLRDTKTKFSS